MNKELQQKYTNLKAFIAELDDVVVAYSGGVDSALLLKVTVEVLGSEKVKAVMGKSASMPQSEFEEALETAKEIGVEPTIIETTEFELPEYTNNPTDRCFHCKKVIFGAFKRFLAENHVKFLIDGSNYDDLKDYRPGKKALEELKVISPLKETKLTKAEIRELSKELELPTWDKEAMACLSTRIAYNEKITVEKLKMIEAAEVYLRENGFTNVRVRLTGDSAKIEVNPEQVIHFFSEGLLTDVIAIMKSIGFGSVTLDLEGYRMGSMNSGLK